MAFALVNAMQQANGYEPYMFLTSKNYNDFAAQIINSDRFYGAKTVHEFCGIAAQTGHLMVQNKTGLYIYAVSGLDPQTATVTHIVTITYGRSSI